MIVLVRIDDRLIHGQVVVGWVNEVKSNHIVVVNNDVAKDESYKSLMEIAVPSSIKVSFFDVDSAVEKLEDDELKKYRVLLLVSSPVDLFHMVKKGFVLKQVNVGGMRYKAGKKEILKSVFVNSADIEALKKLSALGIAIEGRATPTDRIVDIIKCLTE